MKSSLNAGLGEVVLGLFGTLEAQILHHLIFFLWRYVKNQVYQTPVRDLADLCHRIAAAVANVTPAMLENIWREIEYRLDV